MNLIKLDTLYGDVELNDTESCCIILNILSFIIISTIVKSFWVGIIVLINNILWVYLLFSVAGKLKEEADIWHEEVKAQCEWDGI